jgi:RNA polymerase sigma factor (sigma-70 family)
VSAPPSQSAEEKRKCRVLVQALRRLPRRYRDVFVLHRFTGMPLKQIAARLCINQQAVEARLAEALVRLSRAVDEERGGGASERS